MKVQKIIKKNNYYILSLSNGDKIKTYEEVIIKNNLLYKKVINDKLLKKIKDDNAYYKVYNNVLGLINKRFRSEHEVRQYLNKNEINADTQSEIINKLKGLNLINDNNYAIMYVNDRINLSLDGPYKIKRHLILNNIDSDVIEKVIESIPNTVIDDHINKILEKKTKSSTKYSEKVYKQKLLLYLKNMGYPVERVKYLIENITINRNDKEFEKAYNTLSKKYSGNELKTNFILKMLTKGHKREEINDFLSENNM